MIKVIQEQPEEQDFDEIFAKLALRKNGQSRPGGFGLPAE